ncbi:WXG100 family type VII secretion target [Lentzea sp. DG1S-22]|uniref:WXG100 family type VII secretion target n=1 Tax=Lentzea sp. DG1S-22 TaxID=3108822 RepID=UPI003FA5B087
MSGYRQLTDWNFDGWSNQQLADEVAKLSSSSMASRFGQASEALRSLADTLESVDREIRKQLDDLDITWGGAAGENRKQKTDVVAAGLDQSTQATNQSSQAMTQQGESTSQARHSTPPSNTLRGDTEQNFGDKVGGFFGIETDHAKEVEATNRARQQAIDSLNGYVSGSQNSLDGFRAPQQAPDIVVTSGAVATPVGPPVSLPQSGTPGITGGGPGFTGSPGSPGSPGVPLGPTPSIPGNSTGVLPGTGTQGPIAAGPGLPKPFGAPSIGVAAAAAAAAGLAGTTGGARGAQVVGGGRGPSQAPKTPIAPAGPKGAPSTIGAGKGGGGGAGGAGGPGAGAGGTGAAGKGAMTPGGAAGVGPEANRAGAAAAGKGAVGGKGAGPLMSPAASAARGEGEEDGEHVRKYGVDSDEMFGDDRMVVQSVIGEDPKDK